MAVTQGLIFAHAFDDEITEAAWSGKPSWSVAAANDRIINPDLQKLIAKKIGA